ncbi:MAG: DUF86 domain-containing protein [Candidatus Ornithomonoglobus sp.]
MLHRDYITLTKIVEETDIAIQMLGKAEFNDFMENELLKRAVSMTIINIGELVKNLTYDFRAAHSDVPWKDIAGFRDVAAHKYKTLDMRLVYNSVKIDIPDLKYNIKKILSEEV